MALWDGLITPFNVFISQTPQGRCMHALTSLVHPLIGMRWGLLCDDPPSEVHSQRCLGFEFLPLPSLLFPLFLCWFAICNSSRNKKIDRMSYLQKAEVLFPRQRLRTTAERVQESLLQTIFHYISFEGKLQTSLDHLAERVVWGRVWGGASALLGVVCLPLILNKDITCSHFALIYHADSTLSIILHSVCRVCSLVHAAVW